MNPTILVFPAVGLLDHAGLIRTRLAGSRVMLFKTGYTPTFASTLAEVVAHEADFDGYPPGGIVVPAWGAVVLAPGQGTFFQSTPVQFTYGPPGPNGGNVVAGYAVVTADNVLWLVGTFPDPIPFQVNGQGTPITVGMAFA